MVLDFRTLRFGLLLILLGVLLLFGARRLFGLFSVVVLLGVALVFGGLLVARAGLKSQPMLSSRQLACRFCKSKMRSESIFCPKCGRSRL